MPRLNCCILLWFLRRGVETSPKLTSDKLYFNAQDGTLTAVNFNSVSDINYKTNIRNLGDSVSLLNMINTYQFNWKHNGEKSYGVIAQEIEQIFPELVFTDENGTKSVSYIPLIALLIDAVKILNNKIEDIQRTQ